MQKLEFTPLQPLLCLRHGHWVPVSPHTKNEYNPFYHKLDVEYFLFNNFLKKSSISQENREKLFWGTFDQFLGKTGVLHQKVTNLFYHKLDTEYFKIFFKKSCTFQENGEELFLKAKSLLKERGYLATKMNIIFFLREIRF